VSSAGGIEPTWRGDGRELYFLATDQRLMAVSVRTGESFQMLGEPIALFHTRTEGSGQLGIIGRNQYQPSRNGQRFLIRQGDLPLPPITVIVDWPAKLASERLH
jgi:hypothetical protein